MDDDGNGNYATRLRRQSALTRWLADEERSIAAALAGLAGGDSEAIRRRCRSAAAGLDQIAALNATQAQAYEDMIAAGGSDNALAYVEYEATARQNAALYPGAETFGD